ncbi:MAG: baseplate J/gp47 family protein, partial [Minisyncoccia bacterium]
AVKRTSAVSIAKHLGYIPRSARGAIATVNIQVNSPRVAPSTLTLSRYTPFTTTVNGTSLTFVNLNPYVITPSDGNYIFSNVELYEGESFEYRYTVSNPGPSEKFIIPNANIDTSVKGDSTVYFLEENSNGRYEVFFGDNILGRKLTTGNIVILQYLISNGTAGNVSSLLTQQFTISGTIEGNSNLSITTVNNSNGGADKELLSEIKFNAPRSYLAQNRAITADDYKSIISSNYPEVESVAVCGGEDNVPPIYGKVIITIKPYSGYVITNTTKEAIKNTLLGSKRSLGIQIEYKNPEYIYVNLDVTINYNKNRTTATANTAIQGTLIKFTLQKRIEPALNINNSYVGTDLINFQNRIKPTGILSTAFNVVVAGVNTPVYITDVPDTMPPNENGFGTLVLRDFNTDNILNQNIGSVNYANGELEITSFTPIGYSSDQTDIRINASLQEDSYNITANRQAQELLQNALLYADIDSTINSLLDIFSEQFTKNIPKDILADKKLFIKLASELYTRKGTEEAYRIFFRALFNEEIDFFYPGTVILKPSDGKWETPHVIRVKPGSGSPFDLAGTKITGNTSNASAIIESVISFESGQNTIYELSVNETSIEGSFVAGENIIGARLTNAKSNAKVVTSAQIYSILSSVDVVYGATGYSVNDPITITGTTGTGARGYVGAVSDFGCIRKLVVS